MPIDTDTFVRKFSRCVPNRFTSISSRFRRITSPPLPPSQDEEGVELQPFNNNSNGENDQAPDLPPPYVRDPAPNHETSPAANNVTEPNHDDDAPLHIEAVDGPQPDEIPVPLRPMPNYTSQPDYVYPITEVEEKQKLCERLDWRIIPIICTISYFEGSGKYTALQSKAILIARGASHAIFQLPSNFIMNSVKKPSYYFTIASATWAAVQLLTVRMDRFPFLITFNIVLGACEAAFLVNIPGLPDHTPWEVARHPALMVFTKLCARSIHSLARAAFEEFPSLGDIGALYMLYLKVIGSIVMIPSLLSILIMPDFVRTTDKFSDQDRRLSLSRLMDASGWRRPDGYEDEKSSMAASKMGFYKAVKDPKTWFLVSSLSTKASVAVFSNSKVYKAVICALNTAQMSFLANPRQLEGILEPFELGSTSHWKQSILQVSQPRNA
ncbi:hypothetical protein M426DRAFT_259882 [Hypoxylon sp. CI-4A]|nr:hypothetical protein M426DRAFT_259882 [Hypoxylon sp. CI-4A]